MGKCSVCGSKVSFLKEYVQDNKSYCEKCWNKKQIEEKLERDKQENEIIEKSNKGYCSKCGSRFDLTGYNEQREKNLNKNLLRNALLLPIGIISISYTSLSRCPYCNGKIIQGVPALCMKSQRNPTFYTEKEVKDK